MNSIFPNLPSEERQLKSTMLPLWEEFHCYAVHDLGEQTFERKHSLKTVREGDGFRFSYNNDTFDKPENDISENHATSETNELYGKESFYHDSLFDGDICNSFYHENAKLANTTQDPWCSSTTSYSQGDSFYGTDCHYIPHYDTLTEEEIHGTCQLEEIVPRPSVFVTVETDEHVVPECDFALNVSINSDDDLPLQEVPEFLEFDGNFSSSNTISNLLSPTAEKFVPEYYENDVENDSCVPVCNQDTMTTSNSSNDDEVKMILVSNSDEFDPESQLTIPDYLLDSSQDIDTLLFEDSSSDEDDSAEFDRPMDSCSRDHTVPRWSIEE